MLATKNDAQAVPLKQMPLVKTGGYIDGAWHHTNTTFNITDPVKGDVIAEVYAMDASIAADAVTAAQDAFGPWAGLLPHERALVLKQWHTKITENREDLAWIMVAEQGKSISEAHLSHIKGA